MMTIEKQDKFCRSKDIRERVREITILMNNSLLRLTRRCFSLQFHPRISAKALSVHLQAQNLSLHKFKTESRTRMHFAEPGRRGLPFGFVDPLGGITARWKGRWKYTPKMKRRSNIHQNISWTVLQQPQNTNYTTARGLKQMNEI